MGIDAFDKKTIFEIILAANYMDIKSLLHLGCAKIATLIKQLDQKEINRIIEEEENIDVNMRNRMRQRQRKRIKIKTVSVVISYQLLSFHRHSSFIIIIITAH